MALRIFGFPLVVLTAIGDMPFAAVPVIYPYVHFCAAVLTEKQARQRVDFPVPVGAFDGNVLQNPLYVLKVGSVNNRLMHVFRNLPLASVYIVVSLVAVSSPVIKCKKTPRKKCRIVAEVKGKR